MIDRTGRRRTWLAPAWARGDLLVSMPFVVWLILSALGIGLLGGMTPDATITAFGDGFGAAIGEFSLILLPSFTIAAAMSRVRAIPAGTGGLATLISPVAAAGMVCPDTAYAALATASSERNLQVAFGAYAGFKLLFPAGPLIVATGLGVESSGILMVGVALTLPVWAAGVAWARFAVVTETMSTAPVLDSADRNSTVGFLLPLVVLALLLGVASITGMTGFSPVDFFFEPKGALLAAAGVALFQTPAEARRACIDNAVLRTGALLLVIGAAGAFGAVLTYTFPMDALAPSGVGWQLVLSLFGLAALVKLVQGSSMATLAAVNPVAAPAVMAGSIEPTFAVFAICLGSLATILPNDSFYWLVRRDALSGTPAEGHAVFIMAVGGLIQALTGLCFLLAAMAVVA